MRNISHVKKPENKFLKFIRKNRVILTNIIFILFIITGFYYFIITEQHETDLAKNQVLEVFSTQSQNIQDIDEKLKSLDLLLYETKKSGLPQIFILLLIPIVGYFISVLLTFLIIGNQKYSHILLTEESVKFKEISEKKYNKRWIFFFIALGTSVFTSLMARIIFEAFLKRFF